MLNLPYAKHLTLGKSASYQIEIEGRLNESWSGRLAGMSITTDSRGDNTEVTTLSGRVRDQAELMGVLNNIYELHLAILSVKILDNESP